MKTHRRTRLGIASIAVAALIGAFAPATAANAAPTSLTVMTWNINGKDANIAGMAEFIRAYDPDILMVQEIQQSDAEGNQVRRLEAALGSEYTGKLHFGRADHPGAPCGSGDDWVGNAIYSKYPILKKATFELPRLADCPGASSVKRSLAGANISLPGGKNVVVWNTHLTPGMSGQTPTQRLQQARWIEDYLDHSDPLILGGDFNDVPGSATHRTFTSNGWTDAGVSGGDTHNGNRIDYVFTKRASIKGANAPSPRLDGELLTDHRPVIVELTIG